jgi:hypothetical protein
LGQLFKTGHHSNNISLKLILPILISALVAWRKVDNFRPFGREQYRIETLHQILPANAVLGTIVCLADLGSFSQIVWVEELEYDSKVA